MNAIELLKEAAQALETVQHYFPAQDEADKGLAVADVDACQRLMTKIEAYLAEPEPTAMEIVWQMRDGFIATIPSGELRGALGQFYKLHDTEAAALIESYGRRVPRAWGEMTDNERQPYYDKAVEILQDHYTCTRVWSAWSYGTMTQDDFRLAAEDDDIISDTAKMLYDFAIFAKHGVQVEDAK